MKSILFLIFLLMIPMSLGYTANYLYFNSTNYNYTQHTNLSVTLNATVNKTIFVNRLDNSTLFNVSWIKSKNLSNTTISTIFPFNVTLKTKYTYNFSKNITFNITNNLNNGSNIFKIIINYTYKNTTIAKNKTKPYLVILKGNYTVNLSNTLNNRRATLNYTLIEEFGNFTAVRCSGKWLVCEDYPIVFTNGTAIYKFQYNIPLNAPIGITKQNITFTLQRLDNNETMSVTRTITFDIHAPDISMLIYSPPERCIVLAKKPNSTVYEKAIIQDCLDEYQSYYSEQLKVILDGYIPENKTITEYIDHYVMVGNISKITVEELTTCRSERSKLSSTMIDVNSANVELNKKSTECLGKQLDDYKSHQEELNKTRSFLLAQTYDALRKQDTAWKWWYWGTWIFLVLTAIIIYEIIVHESELEEIKGFKDDI